MIKVPSRTALHVITGHKSEAPKADPVGVVNQALESLAKQTQAAMQMIAQVAQGQQQTHTELLTLAADRKPPLRLEADIQRDKDGRMTKIVITPIR